MAKSKPVAMLMIAGTQVEVTHETVPIGSLRLNPDNPRIRFLLNRLEFFPRGSLGRLEFKVIGSIGPL